MTSKAVDDNIDKIYNTMERETYNVTTSALDALGALQSCQCSIFKWYITGGNKILVVMVGFGGGGAGGELTPVNGAESIYRSLSFHLISSIIIPKSNSFLWHQRPLTTIQENMVS